jgi:hypothetical protein
MTRSARERQRGCPRSRRRALGFAVAWTGQSAGHGREKDQSDERTVRFGRPTIARGAGDEVAARLWHRSVLGTSANGF